MVPPPANQLTCPKCKRGSTLLQSEAENLTTNACALNIVQLKKLVKNQHFWCLECGAIPEATCEGRHVILDRMEDVKAIMALLTDVSGTFSEATERRQQIREFLQAATAANDEGLHQLRSLAEKEQLSSTNRNGASSAIKKLEETLKQAKEEDEKANKMWNDLTVDKGKNLLLAIHHNFHPFDSGLSVEGFSSSQPLQCRDLIGDERVVFAVEFSNDGSFFASGGSDGRVLLWPTSKAVDELWTPKPTVMETKHDYSIYCLAVSPDNKRIFSGGCKVLTHDVDTQKMLRSVPHPSYVGSIAMQPETNGNLFATACGDGLFRFFDTRSNAAVVESKKHDGSLNTIMFSPADSNILAVAGYADGALLYDIRRPKSCVYSLPCPGSARFNGSGTRLLFKQRTSPPQLGVYNLPTRQQQHPNGDLKRILLKAKGLTIHSVLHQAFCFAGTNDELAISASDDHNLFIWTLPGENGVNLHETDDQSLTVLRGHTKNVLCVRFSKEKSAIVSCGDDGVIKLWTPDAF